MTNVLGECLPNYACYISGYICTKLVYCSITLKREVLSIIFILIIFTSHI
jgi:hypothetical protein